MGREEVETEHELRQTITSFKVRMLQLHITTDETGEILLTQNQSDIVRQTKNQRLKLQLKTPVKN